MSRAGSFAFLFIGTLCAAAGQIMLKIGADGRASLLDFVNRWIALGLILFVLGSVFWIFALSKVKMIVAYPFTALTFVFVYAGSYFILKEDVTSWGIAGLLFVLFGLLLIVLGG